jgi:arginyl-tRNA synthetase
MTPEELQKVVHQSILQLSPNSEIAAEDVKIERPKDRSHGDWATNVAMQFGKRIGYTSPRDFATALVKILQVHEAITAVEIAGPGFINITLGSGALAKVVDNVLEQGDNYGRSALLVKNGDRSKINIEFVSANPTGPIHIGGVRWAAVGDSLARILAFNGGEVEREYYFNDHGSQIDKFAASLLAFAFAFPTPVDGYGGEYIGEIAAEVQKIVQISKPALKIDADGEYDSMWYKEQAPQQMEAFRKHGVELMFPLIKQSLEDFGVHFDVFFHEQSLYDDAKVEAAIDKLDALGYIYNEGGAKWVATSKFGDDKDRVVIKSNGEEAYFAADIAYYLDKRSRADRAIYMLGADHGGYVGRLKAVARAFGDTDDNITIMIGQLVSLVRGGEVQRMSKRAGTIITLEDLVDAVGVDAARYSLVRSSSDTPLELDLELISSHRNDNPVYYVQYAYARTRNIARNVQKLLPNVVENVSKRQYNLELLSDHSENGLLAKLAEFPAVVAHAGQTLEPHRVARHLEEIAAAYHHWYAHVRVLDNITTDNLATGDFDVETATARFALNEAAAKVLEVGLGLLGVSAPERM